MKFQNNNDISLNLDKPKFNFGSFFKAFDVPCWVAFVGLFVFFTSYAFTIIDFIDAIKVDGNGAEKVWFGILDRFTNQSNWLLFIYCFIYIFFRNNSLLKGNGLLLSIMVYIFFTFIGYNVVLVGLSGGAYGYSGDSALGTTSNVWLHILCPIYFIVFGYIKMFYSHHQEPSKFWKLLVLGMIYPTIYMIYIITIPYTYSSYKVLDSSTNSWVSATYSVYGNATNVKDYSIAWAYILVMYLGFFPGSFALFYYSWKWINKYNDKKLKK